MEIQSMNNSIATEGYMSFDKLENQKKNNTSFKNMVEGAPYSFIADSSGTIDYKGVIFQCNNESRSLCLGDMSNESDILSIPLSSGGCLKVNRNNFEDLSKAIGMFSAEDVKRIMDAIAIDAKTRNKKNEIKQEQNETYQELAKRSE